MTWLKSLGSLIPNLLRACLPCANVNQQSPWADDLPLDIWKMILERLSQPDDLTRFRCVCRSWRYSIVSSVIKEIYHRLSRRQIPWLTPTKPNDAASNLRRFYSPSVHRIYNLRLPEARSCGSSHGWLAMLSPTNGMFLLNPISGCLIPLPPLWMGSCTPDSYAFDPNWYSDEYKLEEFIKKVTLSCSPADGNGSDCVALAIYHRGTDVTFARPGDRAWSVVHLHELYTCRFQDAVYFRGKFYGVMIDGRLMTFDIQKNHARAKHLGNHLSVGRLCDDRYLVESSSGDLLQVYGYPLDRRNSVEFPRARFWVLKFDTDRSMWIELRSLGDQTLFLSCCASVSVRAPDGGECRKNCIYFTGGGSEYAFNVGDIGLRRGVGVFSLEEGSIQSVGEYGPYLFHLSSPLWIMPNLC